MVNLRPTAVDDKQGCVISGLPLLQLLNLLPQLILQSLPLLKAFAELLVLELNDLHVHLLLHKILGEKLQKLQKQCGEVNLVYKGFEGYEKMFKTLPIKSMAADFYSVRMH